MIRRWRTNFSFLQFSPSRIQIITYVVLQNFLFCTWTTCSLHVDEDIASLEKYFASKLFVARNGAHIRREVSLFVVDVFFSSSFSYSSKHLYVYRLSSITSYLIALRSCLSQRWCTDRPDPDNFVVRFNSRATSPESCLFLDERSMRMVVWVLEKSFRSAITSQCPNGVSSQVDQGFMRCITDAVDIISVHRTGKICTPCHHGKLLSRIEQFKLGLKSFEIEPRSPSDGHIYRLSDIIYGLSTTASVPMCNTMLSAKIPKSEVWHSRHFESKSCEDWFWKEEWLK